MKMAVAIAIAVLIPFATLWAAGDEEMHTDTAARAIGGDPFAPFEETVTFRMGVHRWTNAPEGMTIEDNPFVDYVSDKLNVELEVLWEVDPGGFEDKISLAMVSGDLPDAFMVTEQILLSLVEADLITDLTEHYDKLVSPYIKDIHASYGDRLLDTVMFDGRMMAIPGTNLGGAQQMLWIRMDWLDKLGLEAPETLDEVLEIARAFVQDDPDGNGVDDTVGFTIEPKVAMRYNSLHGLDPVFAAFGAFPRLWIRDEAGNIVYGTITQETKEALGFVRQMYQDGLIDKEFVTRVGSGDDANSVIAGGKAGMMFGPWWSPYWPLNLSVENDRSAIWKPFVAPVNDAGEFWAYNQNPNNGNLVVRKDYEYPDAIIKVLNVETEARFASLAHEIEELVQENQGTMGWWSMPLQLDYEDIVYRTYERLDEALRTDNPDSLKVFDRLMYDAIVADRANPRQDTSTWAEATARYDGQSLTYGDNIHRREVAFFGITPTMEQRWAALEKIEDEMMLRIITGESGIDTFDEFVAQWKSIGGDQITEEVVAAVNR